MTTDNREKTFRKELQELLDRYNAELNVTDDGKSYGMHSGICLIEMDAIYDKDRNRIADYIEFEI